MNYRTIIPNLPVSARSTISTLSSDYHTRLASFKTAKTKYRKALSDIRRINSLEIFLPTPEYMKNVIRQLDAIKNELKKTERQLVDARYRLDRHVVKECKAYMELAKSEVPKAPELAQLLDLFKGLNINGLNLNKEISALIEVLRLLSK